MAVHVEQLAGGFVYAAYAFSRLPATAGRESTSSWTTFLRGFTARDPLVGYFKLLKRRLPESLKILFHVLTLAIRLQSPAVAFGWFIFAVARLSECLIFKASKTRALGEPEIFSAWLRAPCAAYI